MTAEHREFLDATLPHLGVVQNLARRCAADPSHAEDLVQETYLRAFAAWPPRQDGSVRAWLAAICLNTARSGGRRLARRPVETPMADAGVEYAGSQDVSEAALSAAAYKAALRAIDGLAEPKRVALVLVDVAGLTAHEAAEALGVPRGTILARVHRARREVAAALDREGVEP